jgi:hypothetical protein
VHACVPFGYSITLVRADALKRAAQHDVLRTYRMSAASDTRNLSTLAIVTSWVISLAVAAFYLVSAAGWLLATHMAFSGLFGQEGEVLLSGLSVIDHVIRFSQVVIISIASLLLIFRKRLALNFFLTVLAFSAISTGFVGAWAVSFIGGPSFFLLALVSAYAYWLRTREVLR